jgi:hypothetical protein
MFLARNFGMVQLGQPGVPSRKKRHKECFWYICRSTALHGLVDVDGRDDALDPRDYAHLSLGHSTTRGGHDSRMSSFLPQDND